MQFLRRFSVVSLTLLLLMLVLTACGSAATSGTQAEGSSTQNGHTVKLTLAAYSTPAEAYAKIIPLFKDYWMKEKGVQVEIEESYGGSGSQSKAVEGGLEADVVALSLENDVTRLVNANLITHDWKANDYGGMVTTSYAVIVVRSGNPKDIQDWADLAKDGVEVLTPDPATSGGAQWNVMAAYGAADRGHVEGFSSGEDFLRALYTNVSIMDKDARTSITNYETGIGDAAITYENEYFAGKASGADYEAIYPSSTILIENPVAVVDVYSDKHGTTEVAQAFVDFLYRPEAQAAFTEIGYRPPVNVTTGEQAAVDESKFPAVKDVFTIADYGGWAEVGPKFFGDDGIFTKLIAEIKG